MTSFKSMPKAEDYLKPGVRFEKIDTVAHQISDNQAADCLPEGPPDTLQNHSGTDTENRLTDSFTLASDSFRIEN